MGGYIFRDGIFFTDHWHTCWQVSIDLDSVETALTEQDRIPVDVNSETTTPVDYIKPSVRYCLKVTQNVKHLTTAGGTPAKTV